MKYLMVIAILISLQSSTCSKYDDCIKDFSFDIPMKITQKDTFLLGDTLWFEYNIDSLMTDKNTGNLLGVSKLNFKIYGDMSKIIENDSLGLEMEPIFEYCNKVGAIDVVKSGPYYFYKLTTDSSANKKIKSGIIVKDTGLFLLSFFSYSDDTRGNFFNTGCFENLEYTYVMNNNIGNHYEYVQSHFEEVWPKFNAHEFQKSGSYAFYVK